MEGSAAGVLLRDEDKITPQVAALRYGTARPWRWRDFRDLRVLAPARWRSGASLFGDVTRVSEILGSRKWA